MFDVISKSPDEVHARLISIDRSRNTYNAIRSIHPEKHTDVNAAAYFIYLNRYSFNGLYRTNKNGIFNVPYSPNKTGPLPDLNQLKTAADMLKMADVLCLDFEETINVHCSSDAIVYLDPPYATRNSRVFTQYDAHSFGTNDIARLEKCLDTINALGAKFILSYAAVPEIRSIANKWQCIEVSTVRNIAGFAEKRKIAPELLICNF